MLNAALLACGGGALVFFGLRGFHAWAPGVAAVLVFVLLALFGLLAEGWATAAVVGVLFAGAAALGAFALHLWRPPLAVMFAGIGLFIGMVNHRRLSVWIPPPFCAAFIAWGCAICWAPNWRGAALWQLNDHDWVLGLAGLCAVVLVALSLEREHRKKLRLAARTRGMADDELKKKLAAKQAGFSRFNNIDPPK